jgi:hypothetical protein
MKMAYLSHKLSMATSPISNYFKRELFNPWTEKQHYSFRSAIIGSTFVARRAGMRQATSATVASNRVTPANVKGEPYP